MGGWTAGRPELPTAVLWRRRPAGAWIHSLPILPQKVRGELAPALTSGGGLHRTWNACKADWAGGNSRSEGRALKPEL